MKYMSKKDVLDIHLASFMANHFDSSRCSGNCYYPQLHHLPLLSNMALSLLPPCGTHVGVPSGILMQEMESGQ